MQRAVAASKSGKEEEYDEILHLAITVIETSRLHIAKQLNSVTMSSYWEIGKLLYERKVESKHGESIIKRLATDLKSKYPDMGLSPRNLWDMKRFYLRYCKNDKKVRQAVAVLPWSHNLLLMGYDLNPEHILQQEVYSKANFPVERREKVKAREGTYTKSGTRSVTGPGFWLQYLS